MNDLLLKALACEKVERPPVWLMRQAGRYLPEYLALREKRSLWTLFHDPELAALVTQMPLQRMPLDAAILFSDLLVLVEVWDKKVRYPEGGGLIIEPKLSHISELFVPAKEQIRETLSYVFDTIQILRGDLSVPLIGFCGAPFTLLCYLLEGSGRSGFPNARDWMAAGPVHEALALITDTCIQYIRLQIEAGAQAIQVFDSWANLLERKDFFSLCLPYWKRICDEIQEVPLIFFSRNASLYPEEIATLSLQGISFDEGLPLSVLRKKVPEHIAVQGNFSPHLLAAGSSQEVAAGAKALLASVQGSSGVVMNLGHGVLPGTPVENVIAFVETVVNQ